MPPMQVLSVNTARAELITTANGAVMSGIRKRARVGAVALAPLGLEGDEQADPSVHGGLSKAVYAYPGEHHAFWQTVRAQAGAAGWGEALAPGALGENLTLAGLLEEDAYIGDVLRFADCELVISEPRYPCFKFSAAMGFNQASKLMAQSGWCGFYLAVQRAGTLTAGERFEHIAGPREVNVRALFLARMKKA
jgi:MOSC domain-containing protein YiiM